MNSKQKYTAELLKDCLKKAIERLQKNDGNLINSHCSERAQVHWLAIYFQEALKDEGYSFDHENGYCIDVEYNRIGLEPGTSKQLRCICNDCKIKKMCGKCNESNSSSAITIDMVLHRRGKNELDDNILCVEIKPTHVSKIDYKVMCDVQRIQELCSTSTSRVLNQPYYKYGLALHLTYSDNFKGVWYQDGAFGDF